MRGAGRQMRRAIARHAVGFAAGAAIFGIGGVALGAHLVTTSTDKGTRIVSLRPTGVGLPLIGGSGTLGIGDYGGALSNYHDSGAYDRDLAAVDSRAQRYLDRHLTALRRQRSRRCHRARVNHAPTAQRRRACARLKPAIVLDIDETSLSNYTFLHAANFTGATGALALAVAAAGSPAIQPTLKLFLHARQRGIAAFFITGRPEGIPGARGQTVTNLDAAGYGNRTGLILKPGVSASGTAAYKSGARADLEEQGYRILLNVGDQESDLVGGHADRAFKLPNPFYFIAN